MNKTEERIKEIEEKMQDLAFWEEKAKAQEIVRELNELKKKLSESDTSKYPAIITIFSGAGGLDAEDFSAMLFNMYKNFFENNEWEFKILHTNKNEHGGYKNISFEVLKKGSYDILKEESGVHRLVRISPFNAKKQRHTSFSMVEVIPKFKKLKDFEIPESDIKFEFSKSGGPGGQNVNKRETAVRAVHIPSGISIHVDSERSQERNREEAVEILKSKLISLREKQGKEKIEELSVSKNTNIEWGNQIRSYVLHPYKMVKDHRTGVEESDVEAIFNGNIEKILHS